MGRLPQPTSRSIMADKIIRDARQGTNTGMKLSGAYMDTKRRRADLCRQDPVTHA